MSLPSFSLLSISQVCRCWWRLKNPARAPKGWGTLGILWIKYLSNTCRISAINNKSHSLKPSNMSHVSKDCHFGYIYMVPAPCIITRTKWCANALPQNFWSVQVCDWGIRLVPKPRKCEKTLENHCCGLGWPPLLYEKNQPSATRLNLVIKSSSQTREKLQVETSELQKCPNHLRFIPKTGPRDVPTRSCSGQSWGRSTPLSCRIRKTPGRGASGRFVTREAHPKIKA